MSNFVGFYLFIAFLVFQKLMTRKGENCFFIYPCVLLYPNGQNGIQNNGPVACNLMAAFLFE